MIKVSLLYVKEFTIIINCGILKEQQNDILVRSYLSSVYK